MAKSFCLTIEVSSDFIRNGLGYMIAFSIPDSVSHPAELSEFENWCHEVKQAVLAAGDECLHPDAYTRKLAIAELMHDLNAINNRYGIQIGFLPEVPAVQVHSANLLDGMIEIEFADRTGRCRVVEKGIADLQRGGVSEHGKTGLTEAARRHFPFKKSDDAAARPPKKAPPGHHPHH